DSDSLILDRERAAVQEWLDSDFMFHIMRDHPGHYAYILAGLWGAKPHMDRELMANLTRRMLFHTESKHRKTFDQEVLRRVLWPATKDRMMAHDSYYCTNPNFRGPTYRPFPTRIEGRLFVSYGPRFANTKRNNRKCPAKCRPPDHQDWELC
ncbi:unnamed protein product, partial [Darwinula stevensoni]